MRNTRRIPILVTITLLAVHVPPTAAESRKAEIVMPPGAGTLSETERAELVDLLERSRSELETLAAAAVGDAWSRKPAPDRWSVGEVVEHLVLAEEALFDMVRTALDGEEDPDWLQIDAAVGVSGLVANLSDRSQRFQAPELLQPKGETGRDDLLARFAALRAKTLDFAHRTQAPIKRHTAEGPQGKMTTHQWLGLVAAHNLRHNQQIAEVLERMTDGD